MNALLFERGFSAAAGAENFYAVGSRHLFDIRYKVIVYDAHLFQIGKINGGVRICKRVKPHGNPSQVRVCGDYIAAYFAKGEFILGSRRD